MHRTTKDVLVVGFALFSMFLGAGNLIFPPYLGLHSGNTWGPAFIGFVLTAVGLPFLAVYATLRSGGTIMTLARHVGRPFAIVLSILVVLSIGPMFAIPRTAATTFEVGIRTILPSASATGSSVIFFALVLAITFNKSQVVDRLGKYLTPFLLITLAAIILAAFVHPVGAPGAPSAPTYNFASGFTEGYQTMDVLAATMFSGVALSNIVARGYNRRADQLNLTIKCGVIAAGLLALVYLGLTYGGAGASSVMPGDLERTSLLIQMTSGLLGSVGAYCLSAAVALACLTTAVGLTTTCGDYFEALTHGKLSYKLVVVLTVLISASISILGVTAIINLAVPFLYLVYPVVMALVITNCFDRFIPNKMAYIGVVIGAAMISFIDALGTAAGIGLTGAWIDALLAFEAKLPLAQFSLAWIIPAVVLGIVFSFIPDKRQPVDIPEEQIFSEN
jgi:LIVCS family branched-chain amino acid:cation transporter